MPSSKPNVLLLMTDQHRYDAVAVNGNNSIRTSNLDALAGDSCRFTQGFINSTVCIPSRACVHTGRYTHQHGVFYTADHIHTTPNLPVWEKTLAERLRTAGYRTGGIGKVDLYPPRGFDTLYLTRGKGARWTVPYGSPLGPSLLGDEYAHWLEARHPGGYGKIYEQRRLPEYKATRGAMASVLPANEHVDYWIAEKTLDFIREVEDEPFFLACSFTSPHGPFDPPQEYLDRYRADALPLPDVSSERFEESTLRRIIHHYYALCTFMDDLMGMVIQGLKQQGLYENTLIIFTTDHGSLLGEKGSIGKGRFYESVIRAPLILKPPHASFTQKGLVTKDLVEHIDLAPTILDYADLRIPDTIQGQSLRPLLEGGSGGKDAVLCEWTTNNRSAHGKCIRTAQHKYVFWSRQSDQDKQRQIELYDLVNDPGETLNLANRAEYASLQKEMHERLLEHLLWSDRPIIK